MTGITPCPHCGVAYFHWGERHVISGVPYDLNTCASCKRFLHWDRYDEATGEYTKEDPPEDCGLVVKQEHHDGTVERVWP